MHKKVDRQFNKKFTKIILKNSRPKSLKMNFMMHFQAYLILYSFVCRAAVFQMQHGRDIYYLEIYGL